jgi:hypothetical protein
VDEQPKVTEDMPRKPKMPPPCDLAEVPVAAAPAPHDERSSSAVNGARGPLDVCVVGQGPTAVSAALAATERGLSVVLLSQPGHADQAIVRPGVLGHRHPYGFRWLVRRFGRRAAESYVRGSRSGTDRVERLVRAFQLDCDLGVAPCWLRAFDGGARSVRAEVTASERLGLSSAPTGSDCCVALPPSECFVVPDERSLDEDAYVRSATEKARRLGAWVDPGRVRALRRRGGKASRWEVRTDTGSFAARHVVLTDQPLRGVEHRGRSRRMIADRLLVEVVADLPLGTWWLHDRYPIEMVIRGHDRPGRSRIWLTRFGGRPSAGDELALWIQRTWGDALIRHRWGV